ncbi:endoglucanase [Streptomyces sp. NPDC020412]|uniref:endoglucanase n=1 Tax=Streptomyces sp. NPDC020412 TaxID=3365073 RepID=UPI0037B42B62
MPDTRPTGAAGPGRVRRLIRRCAAGAVAAPLLLFAAAASAASAPAASPAASPGEATGPTGQKLTVSATQDIDPAGQKVTVTGTGYDVAKGIYLAVCHVPEPGKEPSPCLGGTDFYGASGSSYWISNNPPDYGRDLVKKFTVGADGKGGFTLELTVKAKDSSADCTRVRCAVVTRADHTHLAERDQDVVVPVAFAAGGGTPTPEVPPGTVRHQTVRTLAPAGGAAQHVAVDPKAGRLYVAVDSGSARRLVTYATATGEAVGAPVPLPAAVTAMALDAGARTLHLALGNRIATYDTASGRLTDGRAELPGNVNLLAVDPKAGRLYVAVQPTKSVAVYDTGNWRSVGAPVAYPWPVAGLAVDTAAGRGYATYVGPNTSTSPLTFFNMLNAVDGRTGQAVGTPLSLGTTALGSMGVTVDPTTRTGYVANLAAGTVFSVDLAANKVTGTLAVGANPKALAYDATTRTLYAAQTTAPTVAAVDVKKGAISEALKVGDRPSALALDDRTHTLFTVADGKVTQTQRRVSPAVTAAPKATTVTAGKRAVFTASGTGTPTPTVSWEVSADGTAWQPVAGATGRTLTFTATQQHDGNRYRAVLSNPVGSLRTQPAALKVTPAPTRPSPPPSPPSPPSGPPVEDPPAATTGGTATSGGLAPAGSVGGTGGTSSGGMGGTGGGSLASTGSGALPLAATAAALTSLGAALLFLRRRARG